MTLKMQSFADYWTVDRENEGTRLSCFGSKTKMAELSRNISLVLRQNIV